MGRIRRNHGILGVPYFQTNHPLVHVKPRTGGLEDLATWGPATKNTAGATDLATTRGGMGDEGAVRKMWLGKMAGFQHQKQGKHLDLTIKHRDLW